MDWIKRLADCPQVARLVKDHGRVINRRETSVVAVFGHDDHDDDCNKLVYRIDPGMGRPPEPGYHVDFVIMADCTVYKHPCRWIRCKWTWEEFAQELRDPRGRQIIRRIQEAFGNEARVPCGERT